MASDGPTIFIVDAVAPTVSSIDITSDPGDDDTYGTGDKIEVTVTFSENMSLPISISCSPEVVHLQPLQPSRPSPSPPTPMKTTPTWVLDLKGPLVPLGNPDGLIVEPGVVDMAWDFVRRNTIPSAYLEGANRIDRWEYPEEVVREALVNALVHRDYSIAGTDIMLDIYSNRLEILSPGHLPNTVTTDGMRAGMRYARNQTLVNVMRDYGYVDARGMGVRNKIIPGMRSHNGTEPDLIEEENRFTVCLWKESKSA